MAILKNTTVSGTGAITLPSGTLAQRPTASNGMMRFNSTTGNPEIYNPAKNGPFWLSTSGVDIVKQNLTLWYDFGDLTCYPQGGSTSVTNLIRGDYNGALYNLPALTASFSGANQGFINFDGSNDHLYVDAIEDFAWTQGGSYGTSSFTIEIWFLSSDNGGRLISRPWNGSGQYNYWIDPAGGAPYWYVAGGNPFVGATINFASNPFDGNWKHLVCWANSTQLGYYINGGQVSGAANHGLSFNNLPAFGSVVGLTINTLYPYGPGMGDIPGHAVSGYTAIVRFYRTVLTASQVYQNFSAERHRFGI